MDLFLQVTFFNISHGFNFMKLNFINVSYALIFPWFVFQLVVCESRNSCPNFLIFLIALFTYLCITVYTIMFL